MDRNHFIGVVLFTIVLALVPHWINAKTVAGVGEYDFGADITENQSCAVAKTKAESNAIENAYGSTVGKTDWEMCDNNTCDFNSISWSDSFGQISNIKTETRTILLNPRRCRVSIVADVEMIQSIDPTFDLTVQLNRSSFKNNDNMTIELVPSKSMYVAVFNWTEGHPVTLIELTTISQSTTLPKEGYNYVVRNSNGKQTKETIFVIGSTTKLGFLNEYSADKFKKLLQQLMIAGNIIRKIPYTVDGQ
tara:strand:+ start:102 stop:845 length:744 start_codon:yes stop_codon:yes gene_type:complete